MTPALAIAVLACSGPTPAPARAPTLEVEGPVRLVAIGDTGEGNASQRKVARVIGEVCAQRGCDLGLLLGDNLYPRGMTSRKDPRMDEVFTDIYADLPITFYGVLGNHDYGHGRDRLRATWQLAWAVDQPQLVMPAPYYEFSAGWVDLWALDTVLVFWHGEQEQAAWLAEGLSASTARWKVAFGHHPYLSEGRHGNAGRYEGHWWLPKASGRSLERLFEEQLCGQVDLYLSGHEHNRQWHEACGTQWIVSGAGSKTTPIVERGNAPLFAQATEGLVWIELAAKQMTVAFYDQDGTLDHEASRPRRQVASSGSGLEPGR